jgi:hypothetical protein
MEARVLHLIKLCVGCDSVKDLEDWIAARRKAHNKQAAGKTRAGKNGATKNGTAKNGATKHGATKHGAKNAAGKRSKGTAFTRNHTTRMVPKRADELTAGGSLFWVIRGQIMCRERILAVTPFVDRDGISRCHVTLDCKPVLVEPRPYRAFQGWRYLAAKDAPRDLDRAAPGAQSMPENLRRELRDLGLL